jgi:hypothetical protein
MKQLGIPIKLDRVRTLTLDGRAFALIKHLSGVDLAQAMCDEGEGFTFTLEITRGLILAGCLAEDARLTLDKVSQFVTPDNYDSFHVTIMEAIARGCGIPYQPQEAQT